MNLLKVIVMLAILSSVVACSTSSTKTKSNDKIKKTINNYKYDRFYERF